MLELVILDDLFETTAAPDCTTADNNDGKLTGVTTAMEYKKSDAADWTDGTGNDITGLVPGTCYVRVKATDTSLASDNQQLTIKAFGQKETATVTKAPTAKTLTYNGSAQELVNAGEATGGTMQYALGTKDAATGTYSTSIPTGTDAGTYYVWYKAAGSGNYTDSAVGGPVKVTISSGGGNPTPTPVNPDTPKPVTPSESVTPSGDMPVDEDPTPDRTTTEQYTIPVENENTVQVQADITGGNAKVSEITDQDIQNIIDQGSTPSGEGQPGTVNDTITIDLSGAKQEVNSVELSATTVKNLADTTVSTDNQIDKVEIKLTNATVVLDTKALQAVSEQAGGRNVKLVVEDTQKVNLNTRQQEALSHLNTVKTFEAHFESNGTRIGDFKGGTAEVSMPFAPEPGRRPEHYFLVYVAEDGNITFYSTKVLLNRIISTLFHFSDYAVVYDESRTNDTVGDDAWKAYNSVDAVLCNKVYTEAMGTARVTTTDKGTAVIDSILTAGSDGTLAISRVYYRGQYYSVQKVSAQAARGNKDVEKLIIGEGVKSIGKKAFAGCKNLKKVKLTSSAKDLKIGKNAFKKTADGIIFKKSGNLTEDNRSLIRSQNSSVRFK